MVMPPTPGFGLPGPFFRTKLVRQNLCDQVGKRTCNFPRKPHELDDFLPNWFKFLGFRSNTSEQAKEVFLHLGWIIRSHKMRRMCSMEPGRTSSTIMYQLVTPVLAEQTWCPTTGGPTSTR